MFIDLTNLKDGPSLEGHRVAREQHSLVHHPGDQGLQHGDQALQDGVDVTPELALHYLPGLGFIIAITIVIVFVIGITVILLSYLIISSSLLFFNHRHDIILIFNTRKS